MNLNCDAKCFNLLPCFPDDIHDTLSVKCIYISFCPCAPCLNVAQLYAKRNFLSRDTVLKSKVFVKNTT